jgi:hypothetical protein
MLPGISIEKYWRIFKMAKMAVNSIINQMEKGLHV